MASKKDALKAEAQDGDLQDRSFDYNGHSYTVAHPDTWSIEVLEAYEESKVVTVIRRILGEEQYAAFKRREKPTSKTLQDFVQVMFDDSAVDAGE